MSRSLSLPHPVTRELLRLSHTESQALAREDLPTYVHSRLRWAELVLTAAPQYVRAVPLLAFRSAELLPVLDQPIKRWKLELRARPLVPIVGRSFSTHKLPGGGLAHSASELLACGHKHELIVLLEGDLRARRRRCKQCGAARMAALDCRNGSSAERKKRHGNRRLDGRTTG